MSRKLKERPWRSVAGWKASPPQTHACTSEDKLLPLSDSTELSPLSWELFLPPRNGILLGSGLGFCVCSLGTQQRNGQKSSSQKYPNTRQRAFPTLMSFYIFPFPPWWSTCCCAIEQAQRWLQKEVGIHRGHHLMFLIIKIFCKRESFAEHLVS